MEFCIRRRIDDTGRIVIPRDLRKHYDIKSGDVLVFTAEESGIVIRILPGSSAQASTLANGTADTHTQPLF